MVIKANSASIGNFDPTPAINSWMVTITKLWSVKLTFYLKKIWFVLFALTATSLLFVTDGQQITQKDELQKETKSKIQAGRRKISWRQWKKSGEWESNLDEATTALKLFLTILIKINYAYLDDLHLHYLTQN